jgi:hypothetical protein
MAAHIAGHLAVWPTKDHLATILRNSGLRIQVGRYSGEHSIGFNAMRRDFAVPSGLSS